MKSHLYYIVFTPSIVIANCHTLETIDESYQVHVNIGTYAPLAPTLLAKV